MSLSAFVIALTAAVAFAGAMVVASNGEDDEPQYTAWALLLAADSGPSVIATPTYDFGSETPEPVTFQLAGECVRAQGFTYAIEDVAIQPAEADFYYGHLFAIQSAEPFTHTGPLAFQGTGPGGFTFQGEGQATGGIADIAVPLPAAPGMFTFELGPSSGVLITGPPVTFTFPGDCSPFDLSDWAPPLIYAVFPLHFTSNPTWHGGNCPGFTNLLQITINDDGTLSFFQPDTGDLNSGRFWPVPGGGFNFLVQNADHPEAYGGTLSPNFDAFAGQTVWNDQCLWQIEGSLGQ